jgi:hypothetical protein
MLGISTFLLCIRIILGISKFQQWTERITLAQLAPQLRITDIGEMLIRHWLRCLSHLGRMGSERLPKQLMFGEFYRTRSQHGAKKRWMDCIAADLMFASITEWYETSQD